MGTLPVGLQERFEDKWNSTVLPKLAEDEAACRNDEANMRRRIAEVLHPSLRRRPSCKTLSISAYVSVTGTLLLGTIWQTLPR